MVGNGWNDKSDEADEMLATGAVSGPCNNFPNSSEPSQNQEVPTGGLKQDEKTPRKSAVFNAGGAESGAQPAQAIATALEPDPQLQQLTDVWPTLPKAIQLGILAMIQAAKL